MPHYQLFAARDGETLVTTFEAPDLGDAKDKAAELIVAEFQLTEGLDYEDDVVPECDGVSLEQVSMDAVPVAGALLDLYRGLADGLSNMVEGGRLDEGKIPDDYEWLAKQLMLIAAADPGSEQLPPHMVGRG